MRPANLHSGYEGAQLCQMLSTSPNECERPGKKILNERSVFWMRFAHMLYPSHLWLELLRTMRAIHFLHILCDALQQFLNPFFFHDPFFFLNDGANFLKALEYFLFAAVGFLFSTGLTVPNSSTSIMVRSGLAGPGSPPRSAMAPCSASLKPLAYPSLIPNL